MWKPKHVGVNKIDCVWKDVESLSFIICYHWSLTSDCACNCTLSSVGCSHARMQARVTCCSTFLCVRSHPCRKFCTSANYRSLNIRLIRNPITFQLRQRTHIFSSDKTAFSPLNDLPKWRKSRSIILMTKMMKLWSWIEVKMPLSKPSFYRPWPLLKVLHIWHWHWRQDFITINGFLSNVR